MKCPYCDHKIKSFGEINRLNLLKSLKKGSKSIREIAKELDIAPKNVSILINKLELEKKIKITKLGIGKKTIVQLK